MTKRARVKLDIETLMEDVDERRGRLHISSRQLARNLGLQPSTLRRLRARLQNPDVDCLLSLIWFVHGKALGAKLTRYCTVAKPTG